MSELTRRRLLAASGAVAMGAVAGCTSSAEESDDSGGGDGGSSTDGTVLRSISVENLASRSHTVDVIVEFGGEIEDWSTLELDSNSGEDLDRNWPTESDDFRVRARLDGESVSEVRPATWNNPDCLALTIIVGRNSELSILSASGDACST